MPAGEHGHGSGAPLPAVRDCARRARRPARSPGDGDGRARRLPPGHLEAHRTADTEPWRALGGAPGIPTVFIEPAETFYAPYLDDPRFPSDGTIPNDLDNVQPRFGLVWGCGWWTDPPPPERGRLHFADPGSGLRPVPHDEWGLPADPLPEQRRCRGPRPGAGHRRADRHLVDRAVSPRHPCGRPRPGAAAHLVVQRRGDADSRPVHDREPLLPTGPHGRPLPVRRPERRDAGIPLRNRDTSLRWRHQHPDGRRIDGPLALPRDHGGAPGRCCRRRSRLRGELHPGLRSLRRRQRARPLQPPVRRSPQPRRRVWLV